MCTSLTSTFKTILFLALVLVFSNSSNLRNKLSSSQTNVDTLCEAHLIRLNHQLFTLAANCPNGKRAYWNKSDMFLGDETDIRTRYATVFCC